MTHLVETSIENGRQLAFMLKGGRIAKQTVVQAWDE